jgi:methionyl aminopeptidase
LVWQLPAFLLTYHKYLFVRIWLPSSIGKLFHDFPNILHYRNTDRLGVMAEGHTFTIEPMICVGSCKPLIWPDAWTATTSDGSLTAQFEHTLLVTRDGVEALTAKLPTSPKYSWE